MIPTDWLCAGVGVSVWEFIGRVCWSVGWSGCFTEDTKLLQGSCLSLFVEVMYKDMYGIVQDPANNKVHLHLMFQVKLEMVTP